VWRKKTYEKKCKPTILVALTILKEESFYILNQVKKFIEDHKNNNYEILIKPHPTMTIEQIKKGLESSWPKEFIFVQGSSEKHLYSSTLLVTGMSSIALESIAIGIPVIIFKHPERLPLIPVPHDVPEDSWRYCIDDSQFSDAINYFSCMGTRKSKKIIENSKKIRNKYFEPVTRYGVIKFLEL
jgi:CDP-glycerol glycerophosphotransferase (TagB/SpsB family)